MSLNIQGVRPRPRVAVLGEKPEGELLAKYEESFPTLYFAPTANNLKSQVAPANIDLLVIRGSYSFQDEDKVGGRLDDYTVQCNTICFADIGRLLYIHHNRHLSLYVQFNSKNNTREFVLPSVSLPIARARNKAFAVVDGVRGWTQHQLVVQGGKPKDREILNKYRSYVKEHPLISEAIAINPHNDMPFAFIRWRELVNKGLAMLTNPVFSELAWVPLVVSQWVEKDPESFKSFGDWMIDTTWMVPRERAIAEEIMSIEEEMLRYEREQQKRVAELEARKRELRLQVNRGRRRLITHQGDELVEATLQVFEAMGFDQVIDVDKLEISAGAKREDLRLIHGDWVALVEVRGYEKSGGKVSEFVRMQRFAKLYRQETGRDPNKLIYVVNGELDIKNPNFRQPPLVSAPDDVEIIAESGNLIMWSLDLFAAANRLDEETPEILRESVINATGRWELPSSMQGQ